MRLESLTVMNEADADDYKHAFRLKGDEQNYLVPAQRLLLAAHSDASARLGRCARRMRTSRPSGSSRSRRCLPNTRRHSVRSLPTRCAGLRSGVLLRRLESSRHVAQGLRGDDQEDQPENGRRCPCFLAVGRESRAERAQPRQTSAALIAPSEFIAVTIACAFRVQVSSAPSLSSQPSFRQAPATPSGGGYAAPPAAPPPSASNPNVRGDWEKLLDESW